MASDSSARSMGTQSRFSAERNRQPRRNGNGYGTSGVVRSRETECSRTDRWTVCDVCPRDRFVWQMDGWRAARRRSQHLGSRETPRFTAAGRARDARGSCRRDGRATADGAPATRPSRVVRIRAR